MKRKTPASEGKTRARTKHAAGIERERNPGIITSESKMAPRLAKNVQPRLLARKGEGEGAAQGNFYQSVADILRAVRANAYRAVNFAMVEAYWNVGRMIVEEEQRGKERAEYGAA